jgi:thiamine-monophosphate kinase
MDEFRLIDAVARILRTGPDPRVEIGIGDDAALLAVPDGRVVATTDTQVAGVHFRFDLSTPADIGARAVTVNVSDIAAMGCRPLAALLSFELPAELPDRAILAVTRGIARAAGQYDLPVVGGNIASTPGPFAITMTVLGTPACGRVLTRAGARPGDDILVSGPLGGAALGLALLDRLPDRIRTWPAPVRAFRRPVARVSLGIALARDPRVHAAIDLSDGLVADLGHVLRASGVGGRLDRRRIPLPVGARPCARALDLDPLRCALSGGDDYELAAFVAPEATQDWIAAGMTPIGRVTASRGLRIDGKAPKSSGWRHR